LPRQRLDELGVGLCLRAAKVVVQVRHVKAKPMLVPEPV
jgi:hypothetical protein